MYILGIAAYYHDSAAALIEDGRVVAAAQEERFTRKKHDARFPKNAVQFCLSEAGISLSDVSKIVFYDKPLLKFERLIETYVSFSPKGFTSFVAAMPVWMKEKLFLKTTLKDALADVGGIAKKDLPPLFFAEHHQSHAASAFFPSPYQKAAVLCMDGVGEWATTSVWKGDGNKLTPLWQMDFPHSLGMLYSAFTYYTGFKVNSGEYKLMGLAPYGEPKYVDLILNHLLDLKEDGTFRLNMKYFDFATGLTMTNRKFDKLFGAPARKSETEIDQRIMDVARSVQVVTEEIVLRLGRTIHNETGEENLCMAGGVALNCVANGRLLREGPFKNIWVQPAAGDAGGAIGSALAAWYQLEEKPSRSVQAGRDGMQGGFLGPALNDQDVQRKLDAMGARYTRLEGEALYDKVADLLATENVVGWCQGRMEFGPRALGGRSILGDPRSSKMQSVMNLKIKYRESFRPFAPAILEDDVDRYFEFKGASPYMLMVAPVRPDIRKSMTSEQEKLFGIEKLNVPRSSIPAVTHVDYSARLQTVEEKTNPKFHGLLSAFKKRTGCPVLINTSFNVRGEPIVCTTEDAYRCFMRTEMDYLVTGNFLIAKKDQPKWADDGSWKTEFQLD